MKVYIGLFDINSNKIGEVLGRLTLKDDMWTNVDHMESRYNGKNDVSVVYAKVYNYSDLVFLGRIDLTSNTVITEGDVMGFYPGQILVPYNMLEVEPYMVVGINNELDLSTQSIIKTGTTTFCRKCRSSAPRTIFFGMFGPRLCVNKHCSNSQHQFEKRLWS